MDIEIKYKLVDNSELVIFSLTPELYYDKLGKNEIFTEDGIPRFNKAKDYLQELDNSVPLDKIESTIIEIKNSDNDQVIKTTYFGTGQSELTHRKDKNGFELIIQDIKIATNCIHIVRLERDKSESEWKITSSIGMNYETHHAGQEVWYSSSNGEFINQILIPN